MEHISIVNINGLRDGSIYQTWFDQMSKKRRNKIVNHRMEGDQLCPLGTGIVLRAILKQCGLDPVKTQLEYRDNGRTSVTGRSDVHFNLAHSGDFVAGVCGVGPAGIDVEAVGVIKEKTVRRFFHEGEYRCLEKIEDEEPRQEAFFRLWVLKESFMKVTGLGMRLPLDAFKIHLDDREIEVDQTVDDRHYYFKEFAPENSRVAVRSADLSPTPWEPAWIPLL